MVLGVMIIMVEVTKVTVAVVNVVVVVVVVLLVVVVVVKVAHGLVVVVVGFVAVFPEARYPALRVAGNYEREQAKIERHVSCGDIKPLGWLSGASRYTMFQITLVGHSRDDTPVMACFNPTDARNSKLQKTSRDE